MQRSFCYEALERSFCKVTSFFLIFNSFLFVSRKNSNKLTYPDNKCNNNCFFDMYRGCYPRSSHRLRKLGGYLDLGPRLGNISRYREKRVIAVSLLPNEGNNLSVIHSSKKQIISIDKAHGRLPSNIDQNLEVIVINQEVVL